METASVRIAFNSEVSADVESLIEQADNNPARAIMDKSGSILIFTEISIQHSRARFCCYRVQFFHQFSAG